MPKEVKIAKKDIKNSKPQKAIIQTTRAIPTTGQKAADALTKWAGSWVFIISFLVFLVIWAALNVYAWIGKWDPYPFILLNLVLSMLAALQAPVILMSQNRQAQKDRIKSEYDYRINRKSEREIQDIKRQLNRIETKFINQQK